MPLVWTLAAACVLLGALVAAGSLADHGHTIVPGVILGAAAAALGFAAARDLFARVRRRLDAGGRERAARLRRGHRRWPAPASRSSSRRSPSSWSARSRGCSLGGRRREGEKYAGLRILR